MHAVWSTPVQCWTAFNFIPPTGMPAGRPGYADDHATVKSPSMVPYGLLRYDRSAVSNANTATLLCVSVTPLHH